MSLRTSQEDYEGNLDERVSPWFWEDKPRPPEDRSLGFACRDLMRTLPRRGSDVLHDSSNNTTADGRVRKEKKERSSICISGHVLTETGDRCLL